MPGAGGEDGDSKTYRLVQSRLSLKDQILSWSDRDAVVADYSLAELTEATLRFRKTAGDWLGMFVFLLLTLVSGAGLVLWAFPAGSVLGWILCGLTGLISLLLTLGALSSKSARLVLRGKHGTIEIPLAEQRPVVEAFFGEMRERAALGRFMMSFRTEG